MTKKVVIDAEKFEAMINGYVPNFTEEEQQELNTLKEGEDQNAYLSKYNELKTKYTSEIKEQLGVQDFNEDYMKQRMTHKELLDKALKEHNDIGITAEKIQQNISPQVKEMFESGTITYEQMLQHAVSSFKSTNKLVAKKVEEDDSDQPDLSKASGNGGSQPNGQENQDFSSYGDNKTVF